MRIWNAQVVTADRVLPNGCVEVEDGRVTRLLESCGGGDVDLEGSYLLPGLLDLHVHPMAEDGLDAKRLAGLCREVRSTGTAGFLFALPNAPLSGILEFVRRLRGNLDALGPDCGCLGIHFESPYVAHETRGGFAPEAITNPEQFPLGPLLDAAGVWGKYLNISPELPGAVDTIRECARRGIPVSLGHTYADRETLLAAVEAGAKTVCHAFNTGPIQRWKEPGVLDVTVNFLGMALDGMVCELICDGCHVDPLLVKMLYHAKGCDGIALITDSILGGRAAEEGQEIAVGTQTYYVKDGVGRNGEGGLTGSTLNMAKAVANFMAFSGCSIVEAARAGSLTPARLLNLESGHGTIAPGRKALFCVLDRHFSPRTDLCRVVNGAE